MTTLTERAAAVAAADGHDRRRPEAPGRRRYVPLLHRVAGINAALVVVAVTVTILVLAPGKVSALALDEEVAVVLGAVGLVVLANLYLLRRIVGPLQALTRFARAVDLDRLRDRMPGAQPTSEAGELALTFNEMLSRLESERRASTARPPAPRRSCRCAPLPTPLRLACSTRWETWQRSRRPLRPTPRNWPLSR